MRVPLGGVVNGVDNNPEFNKKHPRKPDGTFMSVLAAKLFTLAAELKKPKPIQPELKEQGKVIIMQNSLPFEPGELDYVLEELTKNISKQEREDGFISKQLPREKDKKYYFYDLFYNENGNQFISKYEITEDELFND